MKKPDKAVREQTVRVALGVGALVALMLAVYAVIGRFSLPVALGGVYSGALGILNFFIMGMMVQSITERMAEKERTEQEIADLTIQMQNRMKVSYNMRMIGLFALLVLGIAVFRFDPLATILPSVFPSIIIRILQITAARKAPDSKGSEEP